MLRNWEDSQVVGNRSPILGLGLLVLAASACTTTTYAGRPSTDDRVGAAMQQPFRDISWMREDPPEILKRAAAEPYALEGELACESVRAEISALDVVLGPDVDRFDVSDESSADAGGLAAGAILTVIGLPFRGVIRRLSGAEHREKVLADAILSGMARRAFLKGAALAAGCAETPAPE